MTKAAPSPVWSMTSDVIHFLTIQDDDGQRTVILENAAYALGRDPVNAIVINSVKVSRQHALLLRIPNPQKGSYRYQIMDGNAEGKPSKNGLRVKGRQIRSRVLETGDVVELASGVTLSYNTEAARDFSPEDFAHDYRSIKAAPSDARKTAVLSQMPPPTTVPLQPRPTSGSLWERMKGLWK